MQTKSSIFFFVIKGNQNANDKNAKYDKNEVREKSDDAIKKNIYDWIVNGSLSKEEWVEI